MSSRFFLRILVVRADAQLELDLVQNIQETKNGYEAVGAQLADTVTSRER